MRRSLVWAMVLGVGLSVGAACSKDMPTSAELDTPFKLRQDSLGLAGPGQARLDVSAANRNVCDVSTAVRNEKGKFLHWKTDRKNVDVKGSPNDVRVTSAVAIRFDSKGLQSDDVRCVLPVGDSAKQFIANYFTQQQSEQVMTKTGFVTASAFHPGTSCWSFDPGSYWNCADSVCYVTEYYLRSSIRSEGFATVPSRPSSMYLGPIYLCEGGVGDGCTMQIQDDHTAFHCDSAPPDSGSGPGANCGDGEHDSTTAIRRIASVCVPNTPPPCVETTKYNCREPLTIQDSVAINAMWQYLKPITLVAPQHQALCQQLTNILITALQDKKIQRGIYNTGDGPNPHSAQTLAPYVHVEPSVLNDAQASVAGKQFLLSVLLHEAAHLAGYPPHLTGETSGNYTTYPWNTMNFNYSSYTTACAN